MIILSLNRNHNGSVCILKDGDVIYHSEEERHSRIKWEETPYKSLIKGLELVDRIDYLLITGLHDDNTNDFYVTLVQKYIKNKFKVIINDGQHHLWHAATGFYNSGFKKAVIVVMDGHGAKVEETPSIFDEELVEIESVYVGEYPNKFTEIYKKDNSDTNYLSLGIMFETLSYKIFGDVTSAGKVMGLSSYGNNKNYPLEFNINSGGQTMSIDSEIDPKDASLTLQTYANERIKDILKNAVIESGCNNIIFTGGVALNCVANYEYLKVKDKNINFYVEPISTDSGTSFGYAKLYHHNITQDMTIRKQTNVYYGLKYNIDNIKGDTVNYSDVAKLLTEGKIISMYQGGAESGPRSLGNRTILFDPRIKNGKEIVNKVKKREEFRPFAGTILQEHLHDWFDMEGLDESPFMMYAVNVKEDKADLIPSIIHVDGTCRIQSLKKETNKHFYNLIQEFYKQTGVPVLFNTSFNLAGEPIVETPQDAIKTLNNSDIDYLYFPEKNIII